MKKLSKEQLKKIELMESFTKEKILFLGACLTCTGLNIDYTLDGEKKDEERVRAEIWKILDLFTQLKKMTDDKEVIKELDAMAEEISYV